MARVKHIREVKESNDVYIGRGSKWGNPYVIGKDGNRDEVIEKYRLYARLLYLCCNSILKKNEQARKSYF